MKKITTILSLFLLILQPASVFAEELPPLPKGPLLLTSVQPEQLKADYWINRIPNPDRVFKTPQQMSYFNQEIEDMVAERVDVFGIPERRAGQPIADEIKSLHQSQRSRGMWGVDDKKITRDFFDNVLEPRLNLKNLPSQIKVTWGVAVDAVSIRALPTDTKMLEKLGDVEFDQLQFAQIKPWTPVAIFHSTRGGDWAFIQAPYARGWARIKNIAVYSNKDDLRKRVEQKDFLVATGREVKLYKDASFSALRQEVSMGTRMPLADTTDAAYVVWMPARGENGSARLEKAYIKKNADVTRGFLPYTQRNVLKQAFKLLGARYGWGGTYNGRDCSGFIHDVFLSMGVDMPRNSKEQGFIGTQLGNFTPFLDAEHKVAALRAGAPGLTLIRMPLHMMLYIGEANGHFYVIHSTWAERVSMDAGKDEKRRINQVVVSDLTLNGKSYLGSLFDRIASINELN